MSAMQLPGSGVHVWEVWLGWLRSNIFYLHALLQKSTNYAIQMPLLSIAYQQSITGGAFILTFRLHISSDCEGVWSLLSKVIGEKNCGPRTAAN